MWTQTETDKYMAMQTQYKPLQDLYENAGLPETEPWARARYLAEDVLCLTMTDHEVVMKTAAIKGKPEGLLLLEGMVLSLWNQQS